MVNVGIFGATGEVGKEIINVLKDLKFPVKNLYLYAGKSAGTTLETPYGKIEVESADKANYNKLDLAFWAISGDWSKANLEKTKGSKTYIIDNSSAFRYDPNVPLVVPEINGDVLKTSNSKLIANPNCTTAIASIPLHILNNLAEVKKIIFTTYQSASGAGNGGIQELKQQIKDELNNNPISNTIFQHQLAYNIIPHIDTFQDNTYTREEMKTDWETKKILRLDNVKISSTCVRVPVERSHAEDILVETKKPVNIEEFRKKISEEPMLKLSDNPNSKLYPMPVNTSKKYQVEVGRIREPLVFENGIRMFVCGDQLLRGAALNAVLIAQKLQELGKIKASSDC